MLTRNRSKRRRSRWIVVLVICFAIGFIMFARARGEKAPAGQPDGAAFTRAGGGGEKMWDAFGISSLINFMGVITYHYASTLSSLIYTHDSRYV